jgi:hypothetical protein
MAGWELPLPDRTDATSEVSKTAETRGKTSTVSAIDGAVSVSNVSHRSRDDCAKFAADPARVVLSGNACARAAAGGCFCMH